MTEQQLKRIHPLDIPLEVFLADLPTRPCRIIKAEMAYFTHSGDEYIKPPFTVRHLLMFSRKEIRDWPNMGKKSLNEIEEWLRNIGLQLWEQHDERSLRLLRDHPMYYAAPAEEEAPQREHHDINKIAEALRRVGLTLLQTANGYHVMKLGEVTAQAQQQPATHGEPVAWLVCSVNSDGSLSLEHAAPWEEAAHEHINDAITEHDIEDAASWVVRPAYTSPQPTPELVQAARQALEAIETPIHAQPFGMKQATIAALQNALKGST